jgi:TorA-specific chaperone
LAVSPGSSWNATIAEWLAGLFMAPPSVETVVSYRRDMGATLFEALAGEPGCAAGARQMQSAVVNDDSAAMVTRKLSTAFSTLFDSGGSKTVSLYESAYVNASGRLFQMPTSDMDRSLRQSNVSINTKFCEPSDHLSIELAVLGRLIRHDNGHRAQVALLDDHLLVWTSLFADGCRDADWTGFYAGAAEALTGFLTAHRATLQAGGTNKSTTGVMRCQTV